MKEHPIIFSTPMIQAILNNKKTQTRRPITKYNSNIEGGSCDDTFWKYMDWKSAFTDNSFNKNYAYLHVPIIGGEWDDTVQRVYCRYYPGDLIWVRETFWLDEGEADPYYKASEKDPDIFPRWKSPIFMPKELARIWLEVLSIRPERLQDISFEDICAEGIYPEDRKGIGYKEQTKKIFKFAWNNLNAKKGYAWESNPYVWRIEFKQIEWR